MCLQTAVFHRVHRKGVPMCKRSAAIRIGAIRRVAQFRGTEMQAVIADKPTGTSEGRRWRSALSWPRGDSGRCGTAAAGVRNAIPVGDGCG